MQICRVMKMLSLSFYQVTLIYYSIFWRCSQKKGSCFLQCSMEHCSFYPLSWISHLWRWDPQYWYIKKPSTKFKYIIKSYYVYLYSRCENTTCLIYFDLKEEKYCNPYFNVCTHFKAVIEWLNLLYTSLEVHTWR